MSVEQQQQWLRSASRKSALTPIVPCARWDEQFSEEVLTVGRGALAAGKAAALLWAGGQGTRLGWHQPKGLFPLCPRTEKTLFHCAAEKVLQHSAASGKALPFAVMVSQKDLSKVCDFFVSERYFGLDPQQVEIFAQRELPWLTLGGDPIFQPDGTFLMAPNGNGEGLHALADAGILSRWRNRGIEMISTFPIDNPLADPFSSQLIGTHCVRSNHVTLQGIVRSDPEEKIGLIVAHHGACRVVEYSEISDVQKKARDQKGRLIFHLGNAAVLCFDAAWVDQLLPSVRLPWHIARKQIPEHPTEEGWKFETFIFDWLAHTDKSSCVVLPRHLSFAPIKTRQDVALAAARLF